MGAPFLVVFFWHVEGGKSAFGLYPDIVARLFKLLAAGGGMGKPFLVKGHAFRQRRTAAFQRGNDGLKACQI